MAARVPKPVNEEIQIAPLVRGRVRVRIVGATPLYQNRMAAKAKHELLVGGTRKTAIEKLKIKHSPLEEFRDSAEFIDTGPTALAIRSVALKSAIATAAIETAGVTKASVQRLIYLPGELLALYGTPTLRMDVVRQAGINRTPDIRTRAFLPIWGIEALIEYVKPQLTQNSVVTLLHNAGILIGIGDNRQEKGKGSFGSFRVLGTEEKDPVWDNLILNHGREAQLAALDNPQYADAETRELMEYFFGEQKRRAA
jgi:hypothetical protein